MSAAGIRAQRDMALACLVLAGCISLGVFVSVFGDADRMAIARARSAAAAHESLLRQNNEVLRQNLSELEEVRAALGSLQKAGGR